MPASGPAVEFARSLLRKHEQIDQPVTFSMLGREWDMLPGVFAPVFTGAPSLFAQWVPYPVGGSFLEIGSGTGLIAVSAALAGCASVTAVDIVERAVDNTARNARRHGLSGRVRTVVSDLYEGLPGERFDMIFWNSDFIYVPAGFAWANPLERAVFDPGYETHRRYLAGAGEHLTAGGRLLLGFSSMGDRVQLQRIAAELGYRVDVLASTVRQVPERVEYRLLEFLRPG